jgi:MFS transporter, ACDE family, multidrug resistance protein
MAQDAGAIVGPILVGLIADQAGFGPAFLATAAVSLVAALPWLVARETLHAGSHEPGPAVATTPEDG